MTHADGTWTEDEFAEHQRRMLDATRHDAWVAKMGDSIIDISGVCLRCHQPLDEHLLTYAPHWYPEPICPAPRPPGITAPVPAEPYYDEGM